MQGRLLPPHHGRFQAFPVGAWARELELAALAGIDGIEWIFERPGVEENPLGPEGDIAQLRASANAHGVAIDSICADWFMELPLVAADRGERTTELRELLGRAAAACVRRIVLPFVDASALRGDADVDALVDVLTTVVADLDRTGVELHLETDLPPAAFAALLERIDHPRVLANYDTGNSASLGYDATEEFAAYGARIGSVHIKDRVRDGGTVPLGEGDADIPLVMRLLRAAGWDRPLVLQAARGPEGDEVATVTAQARWVREAWAREEATWTLA